MTYWYKWYETLTFGNLPTLNYRGSGLPRDMRDKKLAISSSENLRYRRNASLLQRPRIRILESGMPAEDAAEAPPIRKEWVLILAKGKICCKNVDNLPRVRNEPSSYENRGPNFVPLNLEKSWKQQLDKTDILSEPNESLNQLWMDQSLRISTKYEASNCSNEHHLLTM